MAIHDKRENIHLMPSDHRHIEIITSVLKRQKRISTMGIDTHQQKLNAILDAFKNMQEYEASFFVDNAKSLLVPFHHFDWIKGDRCVFFVWGKIRKMQSENIHFGCTEYIIFYDGTNLNKNPSSTKERNDIIIRFFDLDPRTGNEKEIYLSKLKNEWSKIYSNNDPFKTFDLKNEDQCKRVWDYITKKSNFTTYLNPANIKELRHSIYAAYDLWDNVDSENKKRFLLQINKNEYQRRTRLKSSEKSILNTYITKEAKEKLLDLALYNNKTISRTIEDLILNECEKRDSLAYKHIGE